MNNVNGSTYVEVRKDLERIASSIKNGYPVSPDYIKDVCQRNGFLGREFEKWFNSSKSASVLYGLNEDYADRKIEFFDNPVVLSEAEQYTLDHPTRLIEEDLERDYLSGPNCFISMDIHKADWDDHNWEHLNAAKRKRIELFIELWEEASTLNRNQLLFAHAKLCKIVFVECTKHETEPTLTNPQKGALLTIYKSLDLTKDFDISENELLNKAIQMIQVEDKANGRDSLAEFNNRDHAFYAMRSFFRKSKMMADPGSVYSECVDELYNMDKEGQEELYYDEVGDLVGGVNPETQAMYNELHAG